MLTFPIYAFVGLDNPIINSVYPAVGDVDGQHAGVITISGVNLQSITGVTIGGVAATSVVATSNSVTCKPGVYAGALGLVDIVLAAPSGNVTLTNGFRYWTPAALTDVGEAMETGRGLTHALGGVNRPTDDLVMEWSDMTGGTAQWSSDYSLNRTADDTDYCPLYVANATGSLPAVRIEAHPTNSGETNFLERFADYGSGMEFAKYGFDGVGARTGEDLTNGISCLYVVRWTSSDTTIDSTVPANVPLTGFGDATGGVYFASGASAGKPAITYYDGSYTFHEFGSGGNNDNSIRVIATSVEPGDGVTANSFIVRGYEGPNLVGSDNTMTIGSYTEVYSGPSRIGSSYETKDGWICDMFAAAITRSPVSTTDLDRWTQWSVLRFNTIPYV